MCPQCGRPVDRCVCNQEKKTAVAPSDGVVRVSRQTKGRKGKGVTVITGIPRNEIGLNKLAKMLKKQLGSGGRVVDGTIEIQGDHRDTLVETLTKLGYTTKRVGG